MSVVDDIFRSAAGRLPAPPQESVLEQLWGDSALGYESGSGVGFQRFSPPTYKPYEAELGGGWIYAEPKGNRWHVTYTASQGQSMSFTTVLSAQMSAAQFRPGTPLKKEIERFIASQNSSAPNSAPKGNFLNDIVDVFTPGEKFLGGALSKVGINVPAAPAVQVNGRIIERDIRPEGWAGAEVAGTRDSKQVLIKSGIDRSGQRQYWYEMRDGSRVGLQAPNMANTQAPGAQAEKAQVEQVRAQARSAIARSGKDGSAARMADLQPQHVLALQDFYGLRKAVEVGAANLGQLTDATSKQIRHSAQAAVGGLLPVAYEAKLELPQIKNALNQARQYVDTLRSARAEGAQAGWGDHLTNIVAPYERAHGTFNAIVDDVRLGVINAAQAKVKMAGVTSELEKSHAQQVKSSREYSENLVTAASGLDYWSNVAAATLAFKLSKGHKPADRVAAAAAASATLQSAKAIWARDFTNVFNPEAASYAEITPENTPEKAVNGTFEAIQNGFLGAFLGRVNPGPLLNQLTTLPARTVAAMKDPFHTIPSIASNAGLFKDAAIKSFKGLGETVLKIGGVGAGVGAAPYAVLGSRQLVPEIRDPSRPIGDVKKELRELAADPEGYLNTNYPAMKSWRPLDGSIKHNVQPAPGEYEYMWRLPTDLYQAVADQRKAQGLPSTGILAVKIEIDGKPQTVAVFPHWKDEGRFGTSSGNAWARSDNGYLETYRLGPPDQSNVKLSSLNLFGGALVTPTQWTARVGLDPVTLKPKEADLRRQQTIINLGANRGIELVVSNNHRVRPVTGERNTNSLSIMAVSSYSHHGWRDREHVGVELKSTALDSLKSTFGRARVTAFSETGLSAKFATMTYTNKVTGNPNTISLNAYAEVQTYPTDIRYQMDKNGMVLLSKGTLPKADFDPAVQLTFFGEEAHNIFGLSTTSLKTSSDPMRISPDRILDITPTSTDHR